MLKILSIDIGIINLGYVYAEIGEQLNVIECNKIDITKMRHNIVSYCNCKLQHDNCMPDYIDHFIQEHHNLFENSDQALLVTDEMRQMMDELKTNCENSYKNDPNTRGQFMLYNSEVMIGNNQVLIEPGDSKMGQRVFLGHNTFNSISTYNASFVKETKLWMENLTKKSLLLSGTAEKQRAKFFKKMEDQISALERNIRGVASSY